MAISAKFEGNPEAQVAKEVIEHYHIYAQLAKHERNHEFQLTLEKLARLSKAHALFWLEKAGLDGSVLAEPFRGAWKYLFMRRMLGLTLTVKYILGRKEHQIDLYKGYCVTCTVDEDYRQIEQFIHELHKEGNSIEEEHITFFSNIVLGFNDALIELTGALVGFSFALRDTNLVFISGLITGISASLSMGASAFLQARHEEGKSPLKAALFTGVAYVIIAGLLVLPFLFSESIFTAIGIMFVCIVMLILLVAFVSSILLEQKYTKQFSEMLLLSLGVAVVAFFIGHALNLFIEF